MATNQLPYFPLHVDDYLNDPNVVAMDADAEGCYIHLLCRSWRSESPGRIWGGLVAEMCGLHRLREQYRILYGDKISDLQIGPMLLDECCFAREEDVLAQIKLAFDTESEDGWWLQKRMITEYRRALEVSKARIRGGRNRWKENNNQADLKVTSRRPRAHLEVRASTSGVGVTDSVEAEASEPSTNGQGKAEETVPARRARQGSLDLSLPSWLEPGCWKDWVEFRKSARKPMTSRAAELSISRLEKLRSEGNDPRRVIEQSIERGWTGLFALKADEVTEQASTKPRETEEEQMERWRREGIVQ